MNARSVFYAERRPGDRCALKEEEVIVWGSLKVVVSVVLKVRRQDNQRDLLSKSDGGLCL